MLERKGFRAVDIAFPIVCGFNDYVTGYSKTSNITKVYRLLMKGAVSGSWKRGCTSE